MGAASDSLSFENELKDHKFQSLTIPGPRGAYEARQVNGGLYVRVDMPGVPPEGVKIFKKGDTCTVTFSGKAPVMWPDCETSGRVYGGYVILDCNPIDIDVQVSVVNGSLRLFFPNCDGFLHFFPRKNSAQQPSQDSGVHNAEETDCYHNKLIRCRTESGTKYRALHPRGCPCFHQGPKGFKEMTVQTMMSKIHINPFLLDGQEGVAETLIVADKTGERLYVRVDMPGLGDENSRIGVENGVALIFGGEGTQEHHLDEGGRAYGAFLIFMCTCCKISDVKHVLKDGVFRVTISKRALPFKATVPCSYVLQS